MNVTTTQATQSEKGIKIEISVHRVWINVSVVIREKNGVLKAAGVCGSCNSSPLSGSRAESRWGTRKIWFLLLNIIYPFFT